jgi:hypothetical protein
VNRERTARPETEPDLASRAVRSPQFCHLRRKPQSTQPSTAHGWSRNIGARLATAQLKYRTALRICHRATYMAVSLLSLLLVGAGYSCAQNSVEMGALQGAVFVADSGGPSYIPGAQITLQGPRRSRQKQMGTENTTSMMLNQAHTPLQQVSQDCWARQNHLRTPQTAKCRKGYPNIQSETRKSLFFVQLGDFIGVNKGL